MRYASYIALILSIGVICFLLLWQRDSNLDNDRHKAIEQTLLDSIQSIRKEYDSLLLQHDRQALEAFSKAQTSANRMEGEAVFWKNEAKKERLKNRVFSEVQTDSLLSLIPTDRP